MENDSPMLNAFLKNQKYTDEEASDIEIAKQQFQQDRMSDAVKQLGRSQNISDYVNVPSNITAKDIDQVTVPHPHFKNYDHSLEKLRTVEDMIIPEPEPEGLRLLSKGIPTIIENDEPVDHNDVPDFGIDWNSIGNQLGL